MKKVSFPDEATNVAKLSLVRRRVDPVIAEPAAAEEGGSAAAEGAGHLKKIKDMELRHRKEEILKELGSRQTPWLLVVNHLARIHFWKELYENKIQPMRETDLPQRGQQTQVRHNLH